MRKTTTMTHRLLGLVMVALPALACGSSSNNNGTDSGTDAGSNPAPPALGAQVDRQARSAVNTVLNHVFDSNATTAGAAKDMYNAAGPSSWASFKGEIAANLAVFDGLDGVCGNQLLAGATAAAGRYDALAGVLADDQIYVNTATGTCTQYFAVELNVAGDCGGRAPTYDTVDVTLSAAAIGMPTGVTDGVSADDKTQSNTTFPFLSD